MARPVILPTEKPDDESANAPAETTAAALANSEFFGIWRNRTDIVDSVEFAAKLRQQAWQR